MATPAQIAANRANAQHSTGPRTDEGKLRASQNALRHGLCAGIPIMHDEDDGSGDQILDALREEFQPVGPTEEILVYKMAEHFYYGKRASYLLSDELTYNDHNEDNAREIGLMMRYHAQSDRGYYRALTELRKVQTERRFLRVLPDATTDPSAARSETSSLILPTSRVQLGDIGQPRAMERDRSIGSVPSTPESATEGTQPPSDAQPDATTYPSAARSETPPLILPSSPVQSEDTGHQPRAMDRYRSIGSVSQNAPAQQPAPPPVRPQKPVSVTDREDNLTTYPPNQTRANRAIPVKAA
jgi:hypothetical protein